MAKYPEYWFGNKSFTKDFIPYPFAIPIPIFPRPNFSIIVFNTTADKNYIGRLQEFLSPLSGL